MSMDLLESQPAGLSQGYILHNKSMTISVFFRMLSCSGLWEPSTSHKLVIEALGASVFLVTTASDEGRRHSKVTSCLTSLAVGCKSNIARCEIVKSLPVELHWHVRFPNLRPWSILNLSVLAPLH